MPHFLKSSDQKWSFDNLSGYIVYANVFSGAADHLYESMPSNVILNFIPFN